MDRRNLEFGLLMPCLLYSPLPLAASALQTGKTAKTRSGPRRTHTPLPGHTYYTRATVAHACTTTSRKPNPRAVSGGGGVYGRKRGV